MAQKKLKANKRNAYLTFVQIQASCLSDKGSEIILEEEISLSEACPIVRQKQENQGGNSVFREIIEDFTQQEVTEILSLFTQRMGESLISWMVRISDDGAGGISIDSIECLKWIGISQNPFVH